MTQKLTFAALLLGFSSALSRILGVVRDHLFAGTFGGIGQKAENIIYHLDSYYAAFRIPDFIFNVLIVGSIASAFVPIFSKYIHHQKQEDEAWKFANTCITVLSVSIAVLCAIAAFFAPILVSWMTPGFEGEKLQVTINLTRIMLVSPLFFGLSSIFQSIENAYKSFYLFALAPIVYNLSIIIATLVGSQTYGVYAPAVGVAIGSFLHAATQLPAVMQQKLKFEFLWGTKREDFRKFIRLAIPRIIGLGVTQINFIIDTLLGSTLIAGSITLLNYANNLQSLPMGIIGVSVSIVAFGVLAEHAATENHKEFHETIKKNTETILFLLIPAVAGMMLMRTEIVSVILQGGKFTDTDVMLTSEMINIFSWGLIAQSLIPLFARIFFAQEDTRTPVFLSIASVILNIALSLVFMKILKYDIRGLALSNVIAGIFQCVALVLATKNRLKIPWKQFMNWKKIASMVGNTAIMAIVVFFIEKNITNNVLSLIIASATGAIIYFGLSKIRKYPSTKTS